MLKLSAVTLCVATRRGLNCLAGSRGGWSGQRHVQHTNVTSFYSKDVKQSKPFKNVTKFQKPTFQVKKPVETPNKVQTNTIVHQDKVKITNQPAVTSQVEDKLQNSLSRSPSTTSKVFIYNKDLNEDINDDEDKKDREKSWKTLKYSFIALGATFTVALTYGLLFFGKPKTDDDGNEITDEYSEQPIIQQYFNRAMDEMRYYNKLIKEPSRDKLLPDALNAPYYQPPYTLVLEFTDVLVHPEWTYNTGWRFKKRPGLDQFLETLYTRFEMVVYTAEMGMTVFPIMDSLDKNNLISYKLVRDATNFVDGHHVKDLDKLNRNLSKVIVVDWNPNSTKMHTENLFQIPRWDGSDHDTTLYDLAAFLTAISEWEIEDVRGVLGHYSQFENPLANFKERQKEWLASQ